MRCLRHTFPYSATSDTPTLTDDRSPQEQEDLRVGGGGTWAFMLVFQIPNKRVLQDTYTTTESEPRPTVNCLAMDRMVVALFPIGG
jgi:hypothetical protein